MLTPASFVPTEREGAKKNNPRFPCLIFCPLPLCTPDRWDRDEATRGPLSPAELALNTPFLSRKPLGFLGEQPEWPVSGPLYSKVAEVSNHKKLHITKKWEVWGNAFVSWRQLTTLEYICTLRQHAIRGKYVQRNLPNKNFKHDFSSDEKCTEHLWEKSSALSQEVFKFLRNNYDSLLKCYFLLHCYIYIKTDSKKTPMSFQGT